jgi:hypothetical protein
MTDNKRAADDADISLVLRDAMATYANSIDTPDYAVRVALALSSRADGGKGKAVAYVFPVVGSGATDLQGNPGVTIDAPQADCAPRDSNESAYQRGYLDGMAKGKRDAQIDAAECAPREAQPDADYLNWVSKFLSAAQAEEVRGIAKRIAAPTPERADADTAGAKRFKRYDWNGQENEYGALVFFADVLEALSIVDEIAAGASQEHADAGKDAALTDEQLKALSEFIFRNMGSPSDWTGFDFNGARRAILAANKEPK